MRREIRTLLLECPEIDREFEVMDRVGEGTFSSVYKARSRAKTSEYYALKHIYVNSAPSRIENETEFLDELGYVRLVGGMRNNDSVVLVLDHFENHDIKVCVCARAPTRGGTTET